MSAPDLRGRAAVVTGGGRGIGEAIAERLAAAGARLVLAARTAAAVESLAARLRDGGAEASGVACDVADAASVARLSAAAEERLGAVDILVNNAGSSSSAPLHRLELEEWNRLLAVNATGTFLCTKAFLPGMLERGWGRVINIASVAGLHGARYIAAYAASKHAVIGFTRSIAAEAATRGVTVNAVCPGYVDTQMTRDSVARIVEKTGRSEAEALSLIVAGNPQARLITPAEVAHATLVLCDEAARGINGQAVVIDGGGLLA